LKSRSPCVRCAPRWLPPSRKSCPKRRLDCRADSQGRDVFCLYWFEQGFTLWRRKGRNLNPRILEAVGAAATASARPHDGLSRVMMPRFRMRDQPCDQREDHDDRCPDQRNEARWRVILPPDPPSGPAVDPSGSRPAELRSALVSCPAHMRHGNVAALRFLVSDFSTTGLSVETSGPPRVSERRSIRA
jgi:hypothetical protein